MSRRIKDRQSQRLFTSGRGPKKLTGRQLRALEREKRKEQELEQLVSEIEDTKIKILQQKIKKEGLERIRLSRLSKKDRPKAKATKQKQKPKQKLRDPNKVSIDIIEKFTLTSFQKNEIDELLFKRPSKDKLLSDIKKNRILNERSIKLTSTRRDIKDPLFENMAIYHNKLLVGFIVYRTQDFGRDGLETEIKLIATGKPDKKLVGIPLGKILVDTIVKQENTDNLLVFSVLTTATKTFWKKYGMTRKGTENNLAVFIKKIIK